MTVFDGIYRDNGWNGIESRSGPGSGPTATLHIARWLADLALELEVESVLDVGCGDGYWMPDLPGYIGVDVSSEAIALARQRHPDRAYRVWEPGTDLGPAVDLVICRDAIQHLSLVDAASVLAAIHATGSTWLVASTYATSRPNEDIPTGTFSTPNLMLPPFNLAPPERFVFDGYGYHDPNAIRDPEKMLGLWFMP